MLIDEVAVLQRLAHEAARAVLGQMRAVPDHQMRSGVPQEGEELVGRRRVVNVQQADVVLFDQANPELAPVLPGEHVACQIDVRGDCEGPLQLTLGGATIHRDHDLIAEVGRDLSGLERPRFCATAFEPVQREPRARSTLVGGRSVRREVGVQRLRPASVSAFEPRAACVAHLLEQIQGQRRAAVHLAINLADATP